MKKAPKKFCEFQGDLNSSEKKYHCMIGDFQCQSPLCSYNSKKEFKKQGCSIADDEGRYIKMNLGLIPKDSKLFERMRFRSIRASITKGKDLVQLAQN